MRTTTSKNQNTQLPAQVAAEKLLNDLIEHHFNCFSLQCHCDTFIQLVSASTGPDPRSGTHSPLSISGAVDEVMGLISLVRKLDFYISQSSDKVKHDLCSISKLDLELLEDVLSYALSSWIYQDKDYEGTTLNYSKDIIESINDLYAFLDVLNTYNNEIVSKGGQSC